jgi:hypothetical protein
VADVGSVWAAGSWSSSAWAAGAWADASTAAVNGVAAPPARQSTGSNGFWMVSNGTYIVPSPLIAARFRSFTKD